MKSFSGKVSVVLGFALLGCTGWGFWTKYVQDEAVAKTQPVVDSGQALLNSSDLKTLSTRKEQLQQAIAQLENSPSLPVLNSPVVQQNLNQLQGELARVERNITAVQAFETAKKTAHEAATMVQKPPHPLEVWQQVQGKWQEAIQLLESVPDGTSISGQAHSTLTTYRANLGAIETRIRREQQSAENYASALSAANQAAQLTLNPPHPLTVWQQAQGKWQSAITLLRSIPSGTFVSAQAKTKLQLYTSNRQAIGTQIAREQKATTAFSKAKQFFAQAQQATQNTPDSLPALKTARTRLEQGIAQLRQIPTGTTVMATAVDYFNHYQQSYNEINTAVAEMQSCMSEWQQLQIDVSSFCTEYAEVTPPSEPTVVAEGNSEPSDYSSEEGYDSDYSSEDDYSSDYSSSPTYVPRYSSGSTYVPSYTRSDGTRVRGHYRGSSGSRTSGFGSGRSGGSGS